MTVFLLLKLKIKFRVNLLKIVFFFFTFLGIKEQETKPNGTLKKEIQHLICFI